MAKVYVMNNEIKGFVDAEGRLTQLPSKKKKKVLALKYLSEQIPPDREYTEREFNMLLNTLHTFGDPATLRRELYDFYLIDRDKSGSAYRLNPDGPTEEELLAKCK